MPMKDFLKFTCVVFKVVENKLFVKVEIYFLIAGSLLYSSSHSSSSR